MKKFIVVHIRYNNNKVNKTKLKVGRNELADISTSRASILQGQFVVSSRGSHFQFGM